ncbi:hypothetical protein Pcac1_g12525 [Phytophthora cactorum]|uniref:Uncharacterized protein n=1 Tax=Phytophthora cactorum TaxID=29920 RepID=A0A329S3V7_9STRA|nr:hypothetical protein Pcac1_g12525 [Phytophthora cactorum]RAW31523.1 hypothetical protein PC110_g12129 [Phytophthora cactorum]
MRDKIERDELQCQLEAAVVEKETALMQLQTAMEVWATLHEVTVSDLQRKLELVMAVSGPATEEYYRRTRG